MSTYCCRESTRVVKNSVLGDRSELLYSDFSGIHGVINGPQLYAILRGLTPPRILYRLSDHVSNRHHRQPDFCGPGGGGIGGSSDQ